MTTKFMGYMGAIALLCTLITSAHALGCNPQLRAPGSEPIYNGSASTGWQVSSWPTGIESANLLGTTSGGDGFVLSVTYEQVWGTLNLERVQYPTCTSGKKALVFRVKGIRDASTRRIYVNLYSPFYAYLGEFVPATDYMVTPPVNGWQYDPNEWYTVVIPLSVWDAEDAYVKEVVIAVGNYTDVDPTPTLHFDDMWFVEGLKFPLVGYDADTAPISSVFDHEMTNLQNRPPVGPEQSYSADVVRPYAKDGIVTAYTGEEGAGESNKHDEDSTCVTGTAPYNLLMTNYVGARVCDFESYLSYDGHPGIDYAVADVNVYPVADGTVVSPDRCWTYNAGGTCAEWGAVGVDHGNGYLTQYWHMKDIQVAAGTKVTTNTVLGTVSNASPAGIALGSHLHFEIALKTGDGYVHVDPYGWTGMWGDPYRVKAVSVPLWK